MFGAIAGGIASALAGGAMSKLFGGGQKAASGGIQGDVLRSEERFSRNAETDLVCRLLLEKKKFLGFDWFNEVVIDIYFIDLVCALPSIYLQSTLDDAI